MIEKVSAHDILPQFVTTSLDMVQEGNKELRTSVVNFYYKVWNC